MKAKAKPILTSATLTLAAAILFGVSACSASAPITDRWYTAEQVTQGQAFYAQNCAACHGVAGEGAANWRTVGAPPPLNGSAHTWHHSLDVLDKTIANGGAPFGGAMPAFADKLSAQDRRAVIAYIQSLWSADIYDRWATQINAR